KQEGCSSSAARSARPPALAAAALSHAPRRGPGAPQAPSEASLPWTATQAAWHHAATAAPAIMPPRPSPESANTREVETEKSRRRSRDGEVETEKSRRRSRDGEVETEK